MLLGLQRPLFIAAGVGGAGVSIPVSSSGAAIGDIIVVHSPENGIPTLGGTGWTSWTDSYNAGVAHNGTSWKLLTATTDITISGDSFGHSWAIWRGPRSVARNVFISSSLTITFGTLGGSAVALVVLASYQTTDLPPATMAGFTNRASGYPAPGFSNQDILDSSPERLAPGAYTIGVYTAIAQEALTGIELRN